MYYKSKSDPLPSLIQSMLDDSRYPVDNLFPGLGTETRYCPV